MSAAGGKTVKLLVADDNPLVRDLVVKAWSRIARSKRLRTARMRC